MTLPTTLFGPVSWYKQLANAKEKVCIDTRENFVKQTFRSRYQIATATGQQMLSIPVEGSKHANICDIRVSDHNNWRHLHWQALCTAYGSSPFFEYYADDIEPFFKKRTEEENAKSKYNWDYLYQYNMDIIETLCPLLDIHPSFVEGDSPVVVSCDQVARHLSSPARYQDSSARYQSPAVGSMPLPPYYQVFQSRQGFLPDLSILDLLFNLGPEATLYLLR